MILSNITVSQTVRSITQRESQGNSDVPSGGGRESLLPKHENLLTDSGLRGEEEGTRCSANN